MCSNFVAPLIIRAAKFWTSCNFCILLAEVLDQTEEQ